MIKNGYQWSKPDGMIKNRVCIRIEIHLVYRIGKGEEKKPFPMDGGNPMSMQ